ncbi:hypothetical protein [Streptacidiphilus rugosus]|uniref:hypothetical protein n=1 Tax=Streptacidiphilus rugosus TaxID=405783 RepID=UPI00056A9F80|nr:hypothetical protein [Streptacidiphilus rugosus]
MVIAMAFLVPLLVAVAYLVNQQNGSINVAQQELAGTAYLRSLSALTLDLIQYRSVSTEIAHGAQVAPQQIAALQSAVDGDFTQLKGTDPSLQRRLDEALTTAGKGQLVFAGLIGQWQEVKAVGPDDALATGFTQQLVGNQLSLYSYVGDVSKINLDPQPDTFYIGSALSALEPPLVNQISSLGDTVGIAAQTRHPADTDGLIQASGLLSQQLGQLNDALNRAFDATPAHNNDTDLSPALAPLLDQVSTTANGLIGIADQQISGGSALTLAGVQGGTGVSPGSWTPVVMRQRPA